MRQALSQARLDPGDDVVEHAVTFGLVEHLVIELGVHLEVDVLGADAVDESLTARGADQPVSGTVRFGWRRYDYDLQPGQMTTLTIETGKGFPFQGNTHVWNVSISVKGGFLPRAYDPASGDTRYLGVKVAPVLVR